MDAAQGFAVVLVVLLCLWCCNTTAFIVPAYPHTPRAYNIPTHLPTQKQATAASMSLRRLASTECSATWTQTQVGLVCCFVRPSESRPVALMVLLL